MTGSMCAKDETAYDFKIILLIISLFRYLRTVD